MIKRFYIALVSIISLAPTTYGQVDSLELSKPSILNSKSLRKGLYESFDNFRRNQPFYTDSFNIHKVNYQDLIHGTSTFPFGQSSTVKEYKDMVGFKKIKPKSEKWIIRTANNIFGYCDGDSIFISFWRFHPIVEFGHLSLIRVVELRKKYDGFKPEPNSDWPLGNPDPFRYPFFPDNQIQTPKPPVFPSHQFNRGPNAQGDPPVSTEEKYAQVNKWYVLDFMTGELQQLKMTVLFDKFSKWDEELFERFNRHHQRNLGFKQVEFVKEFNKRNPIRF